MKLKIIILLTLICVVLPSFVLASEVTLTTDVPMYNQVNFHNYVNGTVDTVGINDCVPVSVGMVFGYYYRKNSYDLIPNPNNISGDLSDWGNTPSQVGIKQLIEYSECEVDDDCIGGPYSLSKWVNYSYGQLLDGNGQPYQGTFSYDLCHKIRQAFDDYDSNVSITVSYDEINTNMNNKDEIVARIKNEIDNGNPVMFYAKAGLKYWADLSTEETRNPTPAIAPYTSFDTLNASSATGHAMVITAYNNDILRLNFGYDDPIGPREIIIDAGDCFGYPDNQGTCALVFFFTLDETDGVGYFDPQTYGTDNGWMTSSAVNSGEFVSAYAKHDGFTTIGDVSTTTPYVYNVTGTDMYVQRFEDSSSNDTYMVFTKRNDWFYTFPITGDWLTYWITYCLTIGHPESMPFDAYDESGDPIEVQKFVSGSTVTYLATEDGSSTVTPLDEDEVFLDPVENLFVTAAADTKVELVWSASGIEGVSYEIYCKETGGSGDPTLVATVSDPFYIHESLTANTSYDYTVLLVSDSLRSLDAEETVTTLTTGSNFAPTPATTYPALGNAQFIYGYYTPYYYDVANSAITSVVPPVAYSDWVLNVNDEGAAIKFGPALKGFPFDSLRLEFSAKVENSAYGVTPLNSGQIKVRDYSGNSSTEWDHVADLTPLFVPAIYQDGQFFNYEVTFADLLDSLGDPNADGLLREFELELTSGSSGNNETWTFDWIKLHITGVDFDDSYALWYDCDDATTTSFSNGSRIMTPSGSRPSIVSAGLVPVDEIYTKVGIKFSVDNANEEILRVFFNTGSGFANAPFVSTVVDHTSGSEQTVILDIPSSAIGNIVQIAVVCFDNSTYQNKTISINSQSILVANEDEDNADFTVKTVSDYLNE